MTVTLSMAIATCLSSYGLGYAAGSIIRIGRKAIESLD